MRISDWSSDVCSSDLDLVEFGLVVRADDAIFTHRELRKRVALRRILPGDADLEDVILLPDAIDVDVDGAAILRAALDARIAVAAGDELHPRRDVRERQAVAVVLSTLRGHPLRAHRPDPAALSTPEI